MAVFSILFGALFTLGAAWALGAMTLRRQAAEIQLAIGAVGLSLAVFGLLVCGLGYWWAFLGVGTIPLALASWKLHRAGQTTKNDLPHMKLTLILAPYLVWYFVNAMAPETQADGITYHLGLPAEYLRLGGFPERVSFFGMIPQGMEMLYTMAFAFGRHSAAKLIEFGFFAATLPLIFRLGRRLGMSDLACLAAAVFYFCAPVVGLTGSSSYNDAAGVSSCWRPFICCWRSDGWRRECWGGSATRSRCRDWWCRWRWCVSGQSAPFRSRRARHWRSHRG